MYRGAALCYRDCENIGLKNCGIGACASDSVTCALKIISMVQGVAEGIATAVSTIATLGSSAVAKTALKTGVKAAGKVALNAAKNSLKKLLTSSIKNTIKNKAKAVLKKKAKAWVKGAVTEVFINGFCQGVWETSITKIVKSNVDVSESSILSAVDVFGVESMVANCEDTSGDGGLECATSVIDGLSAFDPTGVLTIAAVFMHPVCDVTTVDYRINMTEDEKVAEEVLKVVNVNDHEKFDQDCVHLWSECNFKGRYMTYCLKDGKGHDLHKFNDMTKSAYIGTDLTSVTFFEHMGSNGKFLTFGGGAMLKCFTDYKTDEVDLTAITSNVRFNIEKCYFLNFRKSTSHYLEGTNNIYCKSEPKLNLQIREDNSRLRNLIFLVKTFVKEGKITFYDEENYKGKSVTVKGSKSFEDRKDFGLTQIKSVRIG
jgi:hypothetical protein